MVVCCHSSGENTSGLQDDLGLGLGNLSSSGPCSCISFLPFLSHSSSLLPFAYKLKPTCLVGLLTTSSSLYIHVLRRISPTDWSWHPFGYIPRAHVSVQWASELTWKIMFTERRRCREVVSPWLRKPTWSWPPTTASYTHDLPLQAYRCMHAFVLPAAPA